MSTGPHVFLMHLPFNESGYGLVPNGEEQSGNKSREAERSA